MNYIQQAYKGKNEWYFWVISILLVLFGWQIIGVIPLIIVAYKQSDNLSDFTEAAQDNFMSMGINSNLFFFLMILMFLVGLCFLFFAIKVIHQRTITSLITSRTTIDWNRFKFAFLLWGFIAVIATIAGILLVPENYIWNFNAIPFFILVALSFLFLPFQTSFEELLFRGYFMQGIGVSTNNKKFPFYLIFIIVSILIYMSRTFFNIDTINIVLVLIILAILQYFFIGNKFLNSRLNISLMSFFNSSLTPLVITSVVFGLLHGANPEVEKLGYISMVFYIGTGFFYGITTLMDEGTELALGLHAANNIVAAFFVTTDWTVFQTEALYIDTSEPSVGWEMFFPVLVLYPLILYVFSKKYGWGNWLEKLTGSVDKPLNLQDNYSVLEDIGRE